MLHKLLHIKNLGKYSDYNSINSNWNGIFKKNNAIYADNGSGKTTFAQIIKSLKGDNTLLHKRKTFGSTEPISISFMDDEKKQVKFEKNKWNKIIDNIEVFDSFFIEANVYLITLGNYDTKGTFFEIIVGDDAIKLAEKIVDLRTQRKRVSQSRRNVNQKLRQENLDDKTILRYNKMIVEKFEKVIEINKTIEEVEKSLIKLAEDFGGIYLTKINEYLRYFNPNIQLTKLNKKGSFFVYYLKIMNHDVRSDSESVSLKHTLSEGDKSSLALSFFLAKLSLKPDLSKHIIVFDDPISSFDHNRRSVTINLLNTISKSAKQFILLSHDLNFIKDFTNKTDDCQNLKIKYNGNSSIIVEHNIKYETLTGIFKDLTILDNYIKNGETSEFDKRDIVRCIRPIIEGIFRIKFFNTFKDDEWLGDMISSIRNSTEGDNFNHLKSILNELCDLNDYSKTYHHSNPNYLESPINAEELRNYSIRTFDLIKKI